jgi:carboxymethylenebutenolidase
LRSGAAFLFVLFLTQCAVHAQAPLEHLVRQQVSFASGQLTLHGTVFRPTGEGPFPVILFNHGSAAGNLNDLAFAQLAPLFVDRGWMFFAPYRRGQGLSAAAGPYAGDEITALTRGKLLARGRPVIVVTVAVIGIALLASRGKRRWIRTLLTLILAAGGGLAWLTIAATARGEAVMDVLRANHLSDHLAAYEWIKAQSLVDSSRIATAGNSFGGIITVLAASRVHYCAAIDAAGGAEAWSAPIATQMSAAVREAQAPVFFFQAANDYSLEPTRALAKVMLTAGRPHEAKIYPAFGNSKVEGHSFAWRGSAVWADDVFRFLEANCSK